MKNNKNIDELTSKHIKNLGLEEPSADFTSKVMQSVALLPQPEIKPKQFKYWYLLLIPVIAGSIPVTIIAFNLEDFLAIHWLSFKNSVHPFISSFVEIISSLKNVSPIIIISFTAVLLLLIIEEVYSRNKQYVK